MADKKPTPSIVYIAKMHLTGYSMGKSKYVSG